MMNKFFRGKGSVYMSYESENYPKGLNLDDFISVGAFDSNLVGPTLPPIPPFTLPTGATGSTGPTGDTDPTGVTDLQDLQVLLELPALQQQLLQRLSFLVVLMLDFSAQQDHLVQIHKRSLM